MRHTDKPVGRLENWYEVKFGTVSWIVGQIYDDIFKRFDDGAEMHTSALVKGEVAESGREIRTINNTYLLGKARKENVKWD